MIIAVASGKGGTGKTTVAVNLAVSLEDCKLIDCDVEEPNVHTLLELERVETNAVNLPTPRVNKDKCTLCGKCADFCEFNAIFVGKNGVLVYDEMCHSCGGCSLVCPEEAISEFEREVGSMHFGSSGAIDVVYGELNIGEPIATSVIKAVKGQIDITRINVLDAPPGTACPVIETIENSDYLILVTEPTPFGLHDLSMTVDVVRQLGIPHGVVVNRAGIGDQQVNEYCKREKIPILLEIPFDREIAELYSKGIPFALKMPRWKKEFRALLHRIKEEIDNAA